jgi:hypothetical protein
MKIIKGRGKDAYVVTVRQIEPHAAWLISFKGYRATIPATGDEVEAWVAAGRPPEVDSAPGRIIRMVTRMTTPGPYKPTELRPVKLHEGAYVQLDGDEEVTLSPMRTRTLPYGDREVVAGRITCTSLRCRSDYLAEVPTTTGSVVVIRYPGWELDPRKVQVPGQYTVQPGEAVIEGRDPAEVLAEHKAWHANHHPPHARALLSRWIANNAQTSTSDVSLPPKE